MSGILAMDMTNLKRKCVECDKMYMEMRINGKKYLSPPVCESRMHNWTLLNSYCESIKMFAT